MVLSALAALTLLQGSAIKEIATGNQDILIRMPLERMDPPKLSPKVFDGNRWEFDWMTWGYGYMGAAGNKQLRLRVYSQERRESDDKAPLVARMVMQLWDKCYRTLKINHPSEARDGLVDFYLCFGGDPGGEQLFGEEILPNQAQPAKVNTVYIYQLSSFKDPLEMAREVAHEYGHAILPGIGGFRQPEAFANGYLGEKLFLKWMRDGIQNSKANPSAVPQLTEQDVMGAPLDRLNTWVSANVDPLVKQAGSRYPAANLINEAPGGMDAFLGLALYVEALCPPSVFTRSLAYTRDAHGGNTDMRPPTDYAESVLTAASETEMLALSVPTVLKNQKTIWIPLGKGSVSGATVVSRKNGWAEVAPLMGTITIKNPPIR